VITQTPCEITDYRSETRVLKQFNVGAVIKKTNNAWCLTFQVDNESLTSVCRRFTLHRLKL
jgi:hypothetical protein